MVSDHRSDNLRGVIPCHYALCARLPDGRFVMPTGYATPAAIALLARELCEEYGCSIIYLVTRPGGCPQDQQNSTIGCH